MKFTLSLCLSLISTPLLADPVVIFAAASLQGPLDHLTANQDVVVSYGGSGALARQVLQGAPADIVLLANDAWMGVLVDAQIVSNVADFASNTLVLIGAADAPDLDLADLPSALGDKKLAMGFTKAVPAGIYGQAALENLDLWDAVSSQVVEVDNVRSALALVARGEAAFGITYATDAQISDAVRVVGKFDPATHPTIRYTGGVIGKSPLGLIIWNALQSPEVQTVFASYGFLPQVSP